MLFSDVVGNELLKNELRKQVSQGDVAHAQMFVGREGAGGLAMAIAFAQYLQCLDRTQYDACGICSACKRVSRIVHPDIEYSYPYYGREENSTAFINNWREVINENPYLMISDWMERNDWASKSPNIYKSEITNIIQRINQGRFESNYKILILWLPEYLDKEGNRLLKLIEEPPPNTVFLMVAQNVEKILPTILSRCRILPMSMIPNSDIQDFLVKRYGETPEKAAMLARISAGNISEAIRLQHKGIDAMPDMLFDFFKLCLKLNTEQLYLWSEKYAKLDKDSQRQFFLFGLSFLNLMLYSKYVDTKAVEFHPNLNKLSNYLLNNIKFNRFVEIKNLFDKSVYYLDRNVNVKILGTAAIIRVHKIFYKQKYENLTPSIGDKFLI